MLRPTAETSRLLISGKIMNLSTRRRPLTAIVMSFVMIMTALPLGGAHAGMVSTKTIIEQEQPTATAPDVERAPRERIRDLLARDDVRAEMIALGIAPAEAEARIAALTDDEVAEIAGRLDQLPAGGIDLGSVLVIMFIVFGMAVIMDALGFFDIFPFVCSGDQCRAGAVAQGYYQEPAAGPAPAYPYEGTGSPYQRDNYNNPYRQDYRNDQYYQPQQLPKSRNYYEERFGTQRYVR